MYLKFYFLFAFSSIFNFVFSISKDDDLIKNLPGLIFDPGVNQYSGYFNLSSGNLIHYWLIEAQNEPTSKPLILWLNGGPGCSSLIGLFEELGPFFPNPDGKTLFENIFSWNKIANLLFFESPRDVGFSYRNPNFPPNNSYSDDNTALDNAEALEVLTTRFPEYIHRDFYIVGESYAGVYVPTLTREVIKRIQKQPPQISLNLVGMGLGNGQLSHVNQTNAYVDLAFYRGIIGLEEYRSLKTCCPDSFPDSNLLQYCNFSSYIGYNSSGSAYPITNGNAEHDNCAIQVYKIALTDLFNIGYDPYNMNQDCYATDYSTFDHPESKLMINYKSTDPFMGFPCYVSQATTAYLNQKNVMDTIHIPTNLNISWNECSSTVQNNYLVQYWDSKSIFTDILNLNYPIKILIMNGDLDGVCSFLADEWFIEDFAKSSGLVVAANRTNWMYQQTPGFLKSVGGYIKKFKSINGNSNATLQIDLITVKGAGHMVPQDRPGLAISIIANFLSSERNYNNFVNISLNPKPLFNSSQFETTFEAGIFQQEFFDTVLMDDIKPDQIVNLPGLTYQINFNQYSGFLNGSVRGNYLFYWLTESQSNPASDPLILWLMGGPGCSSVGSLLFENGPFWPNPDGTLFENIFSLNRIANMLYLEAPRGIGFSYQNLSENNSTLYNDELSAADNLAALIEFFSIHNEYQNRDFYIAGLSYGGVYVPTLSNILIQALQNDSSLKINFKGFAVMNGFESNRVIDVDKIEWDNIRSCCDPPGELFCNITKYVDNNGRPKDNSSCATWVTNSWHGDFGYDDYNLYQDCYNYTVPNDLFHATKLKSKISAQQITNFGVLMNYGSTDSNGGFPCLDFHSCEVYLNRSDVRKSLHVPDFVQTWTLCNNDPGFVYHGLYSVLNHSIALVYLDILRSQYAQNNGLKILVYNGDADTPNDLVMAELFIENLMNITNSVVTTLNRTKWLYTINNWASFTTAGFVKSLKFYNNISLDLLTIKGAGHFTDTDRPGPSLQAIYNFLKSSNYSTPVPPPQSSLSSTISPTTHSSSPKCQITISSLIIIFILIIFCVK